MADCSPQKPIAATSSSNGAESSTTSGELVPIVLTTRRKHKGKYWELWRHGLYVGFWTHPYVQVNGGRYEYGVTENEPWYDSYGEKYTVQPGDELRAPESFIPTPDTIPEGCYIKTPEGVIRGCGSCAWVCGCFGKSCSCTGREGRIDYDKWCPCQSKEEPDTKPETQEFTVGEWYWEASKRYNHAGHAVQMLRPCATDATHAWFKCSCNKQEYRWRINGTPFLRPIKVGDKVMTAKKPKGFLQGMDGRACVIIQGNDTEEPMVHLRCQENHVTGWAYHEDIRLLED